ncbi:MAG: hypothetical protein P8Y28_00595 [Gammaproteobacteria bacterium]|jgi:cytochrome bd-type quinol oxidase subunit 2
MSIQSFAIISALLNLSILAVIFAILAIRRKNGKSDIRESRIAFVIAGFVVPIFITIVFVVSAIVAQHFYNYPFPVGQRGGGVFLILIVSVVTSVITVILLTSRIKHKWDD